MIERFTDLIFFALYVAIIVVAIWGLWRLTYQPTLRAMQTSRRISIRAVFDSLDIICANEILIYERYLTNSTDIDLNVPMTNSQFENIYKDLSMRILTAVSDEFYSLASAYMTKEEIQVYLSQRVYNYLSEKIGSPSEQAYDEEEEEDEDDGTEPVQNIWEMDAPTSR